MTFEEALDELEQAVARLEAGGLTLDESLALFERGQVLAAQCEKTLEEIQLRLETLQPSESGYESIPMDESGE
ncbi:MAG: exodeoxyribonuclease VII small subunit [Anaerolineae bacterium]|nr:exodeoxyribonuclease VII small subunit [Anaerolineae bacterium]